MRAEQRIRRRKNKTHRDRWRNATQFGVLHARSERRHTTNDMASHSSETLRATRPAARRRDTTHADLAVEVRVVVQPAERHDRARDEDARRGLVAVAHRRRVDAGRERRGRRLGLQCRCVRFPSFRVVRRLSERGATRGGRRATRFRRSFGLFARVGSGCASPSSRRLEPARCRSLARRSLLPGRTPPRARSRRPRRRRARAASRRCARRIDARTTITLKEAAVVDLARPHRCPPRRRGVHLITT